MFGRRPAFEWLRCCEQGGAIQPRKKTESEPRLSRSTYILRPPHPFCSRYGEDFVTVSTTMKFHVAREGAVMGEFEEQIFRNKVFSGEIRPNDFY